MPVTQVRSKQQFLVTDNVDFQNFKISNLANPTAAQDAATKAYVDSVKQALDIKDSVRVATTANITLSGTQTIDGVTVAAGDRVLVKDQSTGSQNGIYVVAAGAWSRSDDANTSAEVTAGMFVFVEEGTTNGDNGFVLTTNQPITLDTTALTFTQFSGAGQITAGDGLTKSGNTINVVGTAGRIVANADSIDLATVSVGSSSSALRVFDVDSYGRITGVANASVTTISNAIGSQTANTVFAAPNGSAGNPTFRTLVAADIPNLDASKITTGQLAVARGGTGVDGSAAANGTLLIGNGSGYTLATLSGTTNQITVTNGSGSITVSISTGYVGQTSITTLGTISTGTWSASTIAANRGGTGQTSYAVGDLLYADTTSTLAKLADVATGNALISGGVGVAPSWGKIGLTTHISGTLAVGNGGTGITTTPSNGQIPIGNGTTYTAATITAGTGISVTNGSGSITLAVTTGASGVVLASNFVVRETPTGTVNGSNATFTLAFTPLSGTEHVFVNGVLQNPGTGNDYTISGATITFLTGAIPQTNDVVRVSYLK